MNAFWRVYGGDASMHRSGQINGPIPAGHYLNCVAIWNASDVVPRVVRLNTSKDDNYD